MVKAMQNELLNSLECNLPTNNTVSHHNVKLIKYIDLFCGLGAFHTAFDRKSNDKIKYECVFACDNNMGVRKIYEENYKLKPLGDINKISITSIPDFDILCAGFPCIPFSVAGLKKGFRDIEKGNLFFKILEIIEIKHPKTIILENVKNLVTIEKGKVFEIIKSELEKRSYYVNYKIIDSKYYSCPQSRQRVFIICDKKQEYIFKEIKNKIVTVSEIIDNSVNNFFDYQNKYILQKCKGKKSMMKYKLINKETGKGGRQGERIYSIFSYGPTLCSSSGGPGARTGFYEIDGKIRRLSINEAIKMFGFDTSFKYETLKNKDRMLFYLGNSIVINVLEYLIDNLVIY